MEKIHNNEIKYKSIKITFCKLKTNQKPVSNKSITKKGLYSLYPLVEKFYKNLESESVTLFENRKKPFSATPIKKNGAKQEGPSLADKKLVSVRPLEQPNSLNFALEKRFLNPAEQKRYGKIGSAEKRTLIQLEELKKKFINLLMRNGQKSKASKLFADSLKQVEDKTKTKSYELFDFFTKTKYTSINKENTAQELYTDQEQHKQKKEEKNQLSKKKGYMEQEKTTVNDLLQKNTLYQAVENVKPLLELRRVRKGGTTYQVPAIVSQKRQERLAIKWIIESAEKKNKKNKNSFSNCLVSEILDAFNKTGQPRQRRDEQLKVAEFNRAYTLYRWW